MSDGADRLALVVAYDGSGFHGFAENEGVTTVAGELRGAIERVVRHDVRLSCAGRTDAGVHAVGQVVTFDTTSQIEAVALRDALNALVGPAIVVRSVRSVPADLDARFSARWREYRYLVLNDEVPDPFLAATSWWIREPLDVDAMRSAALTLHGEHDFSSFCRRPRGAEVVSLVRRVLHTGWVAEPRSGLWRFEISATAFCHQMVRSIVGTLVAVGRGRWTAEQVAELLAAGDRSGAPNLAPPHGLALWQVGYDDAGGALAADPGTPLLSSFGPTALDTTIPSTWSGGRPDGPPVHSEP